MTLQTQSIYSGTGNYGHFIGISSVASYNGIAGLPNGYDYKFTIDVTTSTPSTTQTMQRSLNRQTYYIYIYYDQSLTSEYISNSKYVSLLLDATNTLLTNVTDNKYIFDIEHEWIGYEWKYAAVVNMSYCVIGQQKQKNIKFISDNPHCHKVYNQMKDEIFEEIQATYFAFGIFDVITYLTDVDIFGTFITNTLTCTQCQDKLSNILNGFEIIDIQSDKYILTSKPTVNSNLEYESIVNSTASYVMYGFICFCVLLAFLGWCYSWYSGADNVNVFSVILFGIYAWDFYADIVFAIALATHKEYQLFVTSCIFIVVPFIINFATLFRSHDKWITDPAIQYKVSEWLVHWNLLLMLLTLVSGSAFAAVELVNCNLFPLEMFSMGLTARHIKKFSNKRLYSTVLMENCPQIALQIYFTFWVLGNFTDIVMVAFVTSILSICFSIIDIYATKKMFKTIKKSMSAGMKQLYYIEIGGEEIENKKKILLQKPNAIKLVFAEMCAIDPRSVNVILCIAIQGGIRIAFEVHSQIFQQKSSVEMLELLRNSVYNLSDSIKNAWKLEAIPIIRKIDLVGDDEKMTTNQLRYKKKKNNFSVQAKRSSISSNRFFSVDINRQTNPNSINIQIQQQQQLQIEQLDSQHRSQSQSPHSPVAINKQQQQISLEDIEKINKEKEEMDKMEQNSSYWGGSTRNINIIDHENENEMKLPSNTNNMNNEHGLHLSPKNSLKYKKKKRKKKRKKKKKTNSHNNNLSIQVQGPSSYTTTENNVQMLVLMNNGSNTDTSVSVTTNSSTDLDDTDLSIEPSPDNMNKFNMHNTNDSLNTINIVIKSDLNDKENVDETMKTSLPDNTKMSLASTNSDSVMVQMGSRSNSVVHNINRQHIHHSNVIEMADDTLIVLRPMSNDNPMMNNHRLSMEDKYVKPTLANADSYNDTEQELDDIMRHVMVQQSEENLSEAHKTLSPILEHQKHNNNNENMHQNEEDELELNSNMSSHGTGMSTYTPRQSISTITNNSVLNGINLNSSDDEIETQGNEIETAFSLISNTDLISDIPNTLPPILESNLDLNAQMTPTTDDDNMSTPIGNDEEYDLEIGTQSMIDSNDIHNNVNGMNDEHIMNIINSDIVTPITPISPINTNINNINNITIPNNPNLLEVQRSISNPMSPSIESSFVNPVTPQVLEDDEEKQAEFYAHDEQNTENLRNSILKHNNEQNKPQTSAEIVATFQKHKSNQSNQSNLSNQSKYFANSDADSQCSQEIQNAQIVIRVNSQNTSPRKNMPSHKLPPKPAKKILPFAISHKPLPQKPLPKKPLPQKPLPQKPLPQRFTTNNY